ncbi:MAG: hypothetical protein H3C43_04240 [Leptonema sp. (in: Bacteria)]|nr:hypothetical protein [Leptonema sp. (in: bacteria)]
MSDSMIRFLIKSIRICRFSDVKTSPNNYIPNLTLIRFKRYLDSKITTWIIFIIGIILRLSLLPLDLLLSVDSLYYYEGALGIADGRGYLYAGEPSASWPIGWPLLMAGIIKIFGSNLFVLRFFTILISIGSLYLVFVITRNIWPNSRKLINLSLFLAVINVSDIIYSNILWSESAHTFFLLLIIYFHMKLQKTSKVSFGLLTLYGLILGMASLVRLTFLPIPLMLVAAASIKQFQLFHLPTNYNGLKNQIIKTRLFNNLIIYIVAFVIIAPYTYRNYQLFNRFILVSDNGKVNLLIGNNRYATGSFDDEGYSRIKAEDWGKEIHHFWREQTIDATILVFKKIAISTLSLRRSDGMIYWLSLLPQNLQDKDYQQFLQQFNDPEKQTLITHYDKKNSIWERNKFYGNDKERIALKQAMLLSKIVIHVPITPLRLLIFGSEQLWYYSVFALVIISFFIKRELMFRSYFTSIATLSFYYVFLWAVFFGSDRFVVPLLPLWAILATYSLHNLFSRNKGDQKQRS